MANLRDVSPNHPGVLPLADSEQAHVSRTSSVKRFFKISKKPLMMDIAEDASETSPDEGNKKLRKSNTLSRIFSRKNVRSNKDGQEQSTSQDIPLANAKPAISLYWKRLFQRQKNRRSAGNESAEEVPHLQLAPNYPDIQVERTIDLPQPHLESSEEPQPQAAPEPEPIRPKKPKKSSPIPRNMSGELSLSALESSLLPAIAEPQDELPAPEYSSLYPKDIAEPVPNSPLPTD